MLAVLAEVFAQVGDLLAPQCRVDCEQRCQRLRSEIESAQIEIFWARQAADGRLGGAGTSGTALEHPGKHPQVLAEAGPEEPAIGVAPEPVDVIDARWPLEPRADIQPVLPVIAEVISAERLHRH